MKNLCGLVAIASVASALFAASGFAGEREALEISRNIQNSHAPYGAILVPLYASPESTEITDYVNGADSAIWTGHYLAAEAYRYAVTKSPDALANAKRALSALELLVEAPGTGAMSRLVLPREWKFTRQAMNYEKDHYFFEARIDGKVYLWLGGTSRDQYSGVMFGLGASYDLIRESDDPQFRPRVAALVTRLLDYLIHNHWKVQFPKTHHMMNVSTLFWGRYDQQLAFLQIGKLVNPARFNHDFERARAKYRKLVGIPLKLESKEPRSSYFKFNLDMVNMFSLLRTEPEGPSRDVFLDAYRPLWSAIENHGNAHFQLIDRVIRGPDAGRDASTCKILDDWLKRPRRQRSVDLRSRFKPCEENPPLACEPIPVESRASTDFLWQRSPFQLVDHGDARIETSGIDYILPYWMARYYGVCK